MYFILARVYLEPDPDQDLDKACYSDRVWVSFGLCLPTAPSGHLHRPNSATKQTKSEAEGVCIRMGFLEKWHLDWALKDE